MAGGGGSALSSSSWVSIVVLHTALLLVQAGMSGYQIITRVALTGGMSLFTFAVYRGAIGLCFLIPAAFFLERNKRPPLTWKLLGHFFVLGLTGVFLSQAFFLEGLTYTSPTFAAAIQNSIPAITFIIAVALGQERVHVKRFDGLAKIMGTLLCVIGATIMVFYKGATLVKGDESDGSNADSSSALIASILDFAFAQPNDPLAENYSELLHGSKSWQIGAFFLMGMCIAFSFWLVIQSPVIKQYPARLSVTAFTSFFGTLQLLVLALCIERNPSKWILTEAPEVLSVLYAGLVVSGLVFSLQMWCVQKGGAVLTAVYQPAQTIIVAILTFLFLREDFFLGSLVGGLLIIGGLYLVTWGQGKERKIAASALATSILPYTDGGESKLAQVILDDNSKENSTLTQRLLPEDDSKTDALC
ncbi:hypothetical protein KP509_35G005600 [Ceratopteris richardii]|uniref:WAT1-related protein n=2 Tax=Ceratopteris richardii TaxID=49495 RepID=A0A8T2QCW0_CERRI|nr:hypothetical protein KP509_35G005600 [Ceratopteris richardii]